MGILETEDRAAVQRAVSELQKCRCVNVHEVTSNVCPVYFTLENPGDTTTEDPEDTTEDLRDTTGNTAGDISSEDRAHLLRAVSELQKCRCVNEHELTSNVGPVYFTLENPGDMTTEIPGDMTTEDPEDTIEDPGDISAAESSTCSRRLSLLVRERLTDDVITLTHPLYVSQVRINLSFIHHYHHHYQHHHLAV